MKAVRPEHICLSKEGTAFMLLYEEETGKIIKACINVFNELGNGFLEAVYQDALEIEFRDMQIPYARESKICRPPLKIA